MRPAELFASEEAAQERVKHYEETDEYWGCVDWNVSCQDDPVDRERRHVVLRFENYDAASNDQEVTVSVSPFSADRVLQWYDSHHAGDAYSATYDGRSVFLNELGQIGRVT